MNNITLEPNEHGGWMVKVNGTSIAIFSSKHEAEDMVRWLIARLDQMENQASQSAR